MTASTKTRYHEAGHALAAYKLGMLHEMGMILNSDLDAHVCVVEESDGLRCWAVKRIAIKLAGPIARILQQGERLHWDTLRFTGEYARDFEEAKAIAQRTIGLTPSAGQHDEADMLMNEACDLAIQHVSSALDILVHLTDATAHADHFSAVQIAAVIEAKSSQQPFAEQAEIVQEHSS
jgi:hypothetical protein